MDILRQKKLAPFMNLEFDENFTKRPVADISLISTEEALFNGNDNKLFHVCPSESDLEDPTKLQVVSLSLLDIEFESRPCRLILMNNWTNYYKFKLRKQGKLRQEQVAASASHDMQTPITTILMMLDSLILTLARTPEHVDMVKIIRNSTQLVLFLVNDMQDIFQFQTDRFLKNFERTNTRKLVSHVQSLFQLHAQSKGLGFTVEVANDVPARIVCDAQRMKQVMVNLISNAVKFTIQGSIKIEVAFD